MHPPHLVSYQNNLVVFRTEKLAVAFVLTQILTKLSAFKTWYIALILYVATELTCNRWLRDRFGI